jgi:hypothetical protein
MRPMMLKKLLSLLLAVLLINFVGMPNAYAASKAEKEARLAEKVKANVLKFGTGAGARVKVKLRDKTKLEGYISVADEEGFTVTDLKTGNATRVAYPQVKTVKGHNLSTGAKIAIGVGIAQPSFLLSFGLRPGHAATNERNRQASASVPSSTNLRASGFAFDGCA